MEYYAIDRIEENYAVCGFARELLRGVAALGAKKVILTGVSFAPDKLGAMGYDSGAALQKSGRYNYWNAGDPD